MCAIVGSNNLEDLIELVRLNSYRGSHSYSLSLFNKTTGILSILKKRFGEPNLSAFSIPKNSYAIVHIQAPTTEEKTLESVHPATITDRYEEWPSQALWHNGIIKAEKVKENVSKWNTSWDTMQILRHLNDTNNDWRVLSELDGTFSCLYYDRAELGLYLFRNEISPMFVDSNLNLSSTKFENSNETEPNKVFKIDFMHARLIEKGKFSTVENPYFFVE
jgi:glutamine phosphoribosylpyrophosphate amidotransferase